MAQKRKYRTNGEKQALIARIQELLKRPGMTITKACFMVDLPASVYHSWTRGRGFNPKAPKNSVRSHVTPTFRRASDPPPKQRPALKGFAFDGTQWVEAATGVPVNLQKAAKPAPIATGKEPAFMLSCTNEGDLTLTCRIDQFREVMSKILERL